DDVDEYNIKADNKGGSRMCRCNINVRYGNDTIKDKNISIDVSDRAITLTIRNGDKNTTDRQPKRAIIKHGDIYDYDDTVEETGR
ncbi:unnamed protein product, partial [Adineta steineri]